MRDLIQRADGRMTRLPFDDLHREAGREPIPRLAERLGYSTRTLQRWQTNGVPESKADSAAISLGSHPANVWPDRWYRT